MLLWRHLETKTSSRGVKVFIQEEKGYERRTELEALACFHLFVLQVLAAARPASGTSGEARWLPAHTSDSLQTREASRDPSGIPWWGETSTAHVDLCLK